MGQRLVLIGIENEEMLPHAVRILSRVPQLTSGVVQYNLKRLPWTLPEIRDKNSLAQLEQSLKKIGFQLGFEEREDLAENRPPQKGAGSDRVEKQDSNKGSKSIEEKVESQKQKTIHLHSISKKSVHKRRSFFIWILVAGFGFMIAIVSQLRDHRKMSASIHSLNRDGAFQSHALKNSENPVAALGSLEKENDELPGTSSEFQKILARFGEQIGSAKINATGVSVTLKMPVKSPQSIFDRGYFLYREIHKRHKEKGVKIKIISATGIQFEWSIPANSKGYGPEEFERILGSVN